MSDFPLSQSNTLHLNTTSGVYTTSREQSIAYSEGTEAENYLRMVLQKSEDLSSLSGQLENRILDWPSEYHLSSLRANILRCLNLTDRSNILELGCGCGTITRYLGELRAKVEGIEGGKERAALAALRCRDLANVKIIQANFNDLELPGECYDAIVMIGVIEYAAMFNPDMEGDRQAISSIFSKMRASLKPNGVLILALENRVGLKYLLGAGEDHCAVPYIGLYDYPGRKGVRTYSRQEWGDILQENGWCHSSFLFPFPDYKLPRVVLTEKFVNEDPYAHSLLYRIESRDYISSWRSDANEFLSWRGLHKARLLPEMSNSFLIVASQEAGSINQVVDRDFIHFSAASRQVAYRTMTVKYTGRQEVVKQKIATNAHKEGPLEQSLKSSPYHGGELLATKWILSVSGNEGHDFALLLQEYYSYLQGQVEDSDNPGSLIELLPSNIIVSEKSGEWKCFDLEWRFIRAVTAEIIFFRAVFWFAIHNKQLLQRFPGHSFATVGDFVSFCFHQIDLDLQLYLPSCIAAEESFHAEVVAGMHQCIDISYMLSMDLGDCREPSPQTREFVQVKEQEKRRINLPQLLRVLKRYITSTKSYLLNREYRVILHSRLFDSDFYRRNDNEMQSLGIDPLLHYVFVGHKEEGRDPSPFFSSYYYLRQFPQIVEKQQNPLEHYISTGSKKNANTHYLLKNHHLRPGTLWRKAQLVKTNQSRGVIRTFFDSEFYCSLYPDVTNSEMEPIVHYLRYGSAERRQPGPFFDPQWYVDRTPIFEESGSDLLKHYVERGVPLGKSPIPVFDLDYYQKKYLNAGDTRKDAFNYYLEKGVEKDDAPCSWFDPEYYRTVCPDLKPFTFPLEHYLYVGVHRQVYVNPSIAQLPEKPLISVIVPVYNVKEAYLNCCIRSVLFQSYPHWELCIVDDGSDCSRVRDQLAGWQSKDDRIKVKYLSVNGGIARASNEAARMASGEYMIFLDNDDELHPQALYLMVQDICNTEADVLYSDETLIGDDGRELSYFYKPGFNRELLYSHNYINHLVLIKSDLFIRGGGFNTALSGAQDHDLLLKISELTENIHHIPEILYRWRASENSTSINHAQKEYADRAGTLALENMLEREGIQGEILPGLWKYYHRVKREVKGTPAVSVLLFADEGNATVHWLEKLFSRCTYPNLEFVIVGDEKKITDALAKTKSSRYQEKVLFVNTDFLKHPAKCLNRTAEASNGEYLLFLGSFVEPARSNWIESLLEYCQQSWCGAVEGKITEDEEMNLTIPDIAITSPIYYSQFIKMCSRHMNGLHCAQEISMASYSFSMIQREKFFEVGGFDERFQSSLFHDCDFSLKLMQSGYRNIYTPYAQAKKNRQTDEQKLSSAGERDKKIFQSEWHAVLVGGDRYYNSRLISENGIDSKHFLDWYAGSKDDS